MQMLVLIKNTAMLDVPIPCGTDAIVLSLTQIESHPAVQTQAWRT